MEVGEIVRVDNLTFRYVQGEVVLRNVSLTLGKHEILGILGPNGAGKTTLLKILVGILKGEGTVRLMGIGISRLSSREVAKIVGYMPQEHSIVFPYRVIDYVLMGRAPHYSLFSMPSRKDYGKVMQVLRELGLETLASKTVAEISGGQLQLVLIARALVQEAKILVLDEPISHLDVRNAMKVLRVIRKLVRSGTALGVILSLHDPFLASMFCDKVIILDQGRVVAHGKPEESLSPDILESVYGVKFDVITHNGRKLVIPIIT